MKKARVLALVVAPLLSLGLVLLGTWADERERARFDKAEDECLWENHCKRHDCRASKDFDIDAYLAKKEKEMSKEPRRHALPDEGPRRGPDPDQTRKVLESSNDECQRPFTSDWDSKAVIAAAVLAIPWAAVMVWLLILAMIRSVTRAVREASK